MIVVAEVERHVVGGEGFDHLVEIARRVRAEYGLPQTMATPLVADGRVFTVGTTGQLLALDGEHAGQPGHLLERGIVDVLREELGLTGTKFACGISACGSCTVIMDGRAVLSCTTLAVECEGKSIQTVEGIAADPKWKPLVDAYCKWDAMQCGYCTPGFMVSSKALLDKNANPSEEECKQALAGNICCCGTYPRHPTAIMEAAPQIAKGA